MKFINIFRLFGKSIKSVFTDDNLNLYGKEKHSQLYNRMHKLIKSQNGDNTHYYKPHIVSIKSKQILQYINKNTKYEDKIMLLKTFQKIFVETSEELYKKFDPHMIYTFNNEIHMVFYHNDYGNFLYDGNIKKILTTCVSYTSILVARELKKYNIELDFCFEGTFVEIHKDYEALNYIIWRQYDCKRNTLTLLYKCLKQEMELLNFIKLDLIEKEINEITPIDYTLIYGLVLKKREYIKEIYDVNDNDNKNIVTTESDKNIECITETIRRKLEINIKWFPENFKETLNEYIISKYL